MIAWAVASLAMAAVAIAGYKEFGLLWSAVLLALAGAAAVEAFAGREDQ